MTANNVHEHDDMAFEQALRAAYDEMDPTPEAEARMFAALKDAQAKRVDANAQPGQSATGETPTASATPASPATPKRQKSTRRIAPWKVALPAAACLALAAIGIGAITSQQPAPLPEPAPNTVASTSTAASASTAAKADATTGGSGEVEMTADEDKPMSLQTSDVVDGLAYPGESYNTEEYSAIEETGFVAVATSPLSTVSADVDTASYANLRRMIQSGYTIEDLPSGAARIEEMLNYFDYGYAAPTGNDRFSMQARVGACPWNPDTQLLVLGFATAKEVEDKPSNLVFLIDTSGSMNASGKLDLLQDSFATLLEHLDADDRVSIVTYAGAEEVVLEGAKGDDDKAILRAIYRLRASGSTNGEAGLKMAYEVAERNWIEGGVNRIVMASDGDLNVGISSESDLHDFVDKKRETGVYLSVLGFGADNYKDNKMETLADHGNGQYHYIDCIEEAEHVLSDKLMQNVVPFADDVKVQVEFNPATVKGYRLIGYENRAMADADFLDDAKDAGDVGPNAQFTVAYEVVPVDSAMEIPTADLKYSQAPAGSGDEWATCSLRYRAFDDSQVHQQELAVRGDEGTDDDWKFAASVIELGMAMRTSEFAGSSNEDTALQMLEGMELNDQRRAYRDLIAQLKENKDDPLIIDE